jgi:transmembrane sensor
VDFAASQRTVDVGSGEAFFEVAKDARRPFVVRIAGSEVVAVGTAFSVRYAPAAAPHADDRLVVTLVEGQVKVRPADHRIGDALAPTQAVMMKAGDRLLLDRPSRDAAAAVALKVDRPDVERVMAWKRSEAVFDETSLKDAVAEMNRYDRTPIVLLDGLDASDLRVSGQYRTSDSVGFASAVAALHGLSLHEQAGRLELTKPH